GRRSDAETVELRQVSHHRLVFRGQKTLGAVVEPLLREVQLTLDQGGRLPHESGGLEHPIHVLRARPCLEGEHHHRSSEEAKLALHPLARRCSANRASAPRICSRSSICCSL